MPHAAKRRIAFAVLAAIAPSAPAFQGNIGFGLAAEHSDNVALAPEGEEESAWATVASVRLRGTERADEAGLRFDGTLRYRDYHSGPFHDDTIFTLAAHGDWILNPGFSKWYLDNFFDQASVDTFAAPTPANRQDVNVLSTGPEARWRLSESQTLIAGARYGNFYFSDTDPDSQRLAAYGRWVYAMNRRTDVSGNVEAQTVDFFASRYGDYDRADGFVRVDYRWSRASVEVDAGATQITRRRGDDLSGGLGRMGWHLDFNSYSGVDLYLLREYTDAGHDILQTALREGIFGVSNEQVTGDVYYNSAAELGYRWQGVRTGFRISGAAREEDYDRTPNDRRFSEATGRIDRDLSATLRLSLDAAYRRADYTQLGHIDTDHDAGVRLAYQINSRLSAALHAARAQRDSTDETVSYEENRYLISVNYDNSPGRDFGPPEED